MPFVVCQKDGVYYWHVFPLNEEAAHRFFPLDFVSESSNYFDARWMAMHSEDREKIYRLGQTILSKGICRYHQEFRCRASTGQWRWLRDNVVIEPQGENEWWAVGVCTDITDIKEKISHVSEMLERRVRERTAQLAKANRNLRKMEQQIRKLANEQLLAQEQERRQIARELHDEIGQWLVGTRLQLEQIGRSMPISLGPLETDPKDFPHALPSDP